MPRHGDTAANPPLSVAVVARGNNSLNGSNRAIAESLEALGLSGTMLLLGPKTQQHPLAYSQVEVVTARLTKQTPRSFKSRVLLRTSASKVGSIVPAHMVAAAHRPDDNRVAHIESFIRVNEPDIVISRGYEMLAAVIEALESIPLEARPKIIHQSFNYSSTRMAAISQKVESSYASQVAARLVADDPFHMRSAIVITTGRNIPRPERDSLASPATKVTDSLPSTPVNAAKYLAIGPANYAGQGHMWAESAKRANPDLKTSVSAEVNPFEFPVDILASKTQRAYEGRWLRKIREQSQDWTHVIIEGALPILGLQIPKRIDLQTKHLQDAGKTVALLFHGTDIRDPNVHMEMNPHSFFQSAPADWTERIGKRAEQTRQLARKTTVQKFVSTPDLLVYLPEATWLPLVVDLKLWPDQTEQKFTGAPPVVLHRPSWSDPPIKGTTYIDPVLKKMDDEGIIKYLCPEHVSNDEMREFVAQADILVDQILTGSYGVAAVEAMASGSLVVGNVNSQVRGCIDDEIPIIDAGPDEFEEVMRGIVGNIDEYRNRAAAGPAFAKKWHDGTRSAEVLQAFLDG